MITTSAVRESAGGRAPAQAPTDLRAGVEDNLRTLEIEQLGIVNLRRMRAAELSPGTQPVPLADQLAELRAQ